MSIKDLWESKREVRESDVSNLEWVIPQGYEPNKVEEERLYEYNRIRVYEFSLPLIEDDQMPMELTDEYIYEQAHKEERAQEEQAQREAYYKQQKQPNEIEYINLSDLRSSPQQKRETFDEGSLRELAYSIRTQGLMQPLPVARIYDDESYQVGYTLVGGERRKRAWELVCQEDGEPKPVPCSVVSEYLASEFTSSTAQLSLLVMGITENLQRSDLNFIEMANAVASTKEATGISNEEIGDLLFSHPQSEVTPDPSKPNYRTTIAHYLKINALDERVKHRILEINYPSAQEMPRAGHSENVPQNDGTQEGEIEMPSAWHSGNSTQNDGTQEGEIEMGRASHSENSTQNDGIKEGEIEMGRASHSGNDKEAPQEQRSLISMRHAYEITKLNVPENDQEGIVTNQLHLLEAIKEQSLSTRALAELISGLNQATPEEEPKEKEAPKEEPPGIDEPRLQEIEKEREFASEWGTKVSDLIGIDTHVNLQYTKEGALTKATLDLVISQISDLTKLGLAIEETPVKEPAGLIKLVQ